MILTKIFFKNDTEIHIVADCDKQTKSFQLESVWVIQLYNDGEIKSKVDVVELICEIPGVEEAIASLDWEGQFSDCQPSVGDRVGEILLNIYSPVEKSKIFF